MTVFHSLLPQRQTVKTAPFATPDTLGPYDILKCIALLLMLCDHIGLYLFPEEITLRALGRLCVPIWLFLIGYARSRRIDAALVSAAAFVMLMQYATLHYMPPLNILWSIIFVRLTLNPLMDFIGNNDTKLYAVTFIAIPLTPLAGYFFEYGTMAWLLAIWGYLMRNGFDDARGKARPDIPLFYGALVLILFAVISNLSFDFNTGQMILLAFGLLIVWGALTFYLPRDIRSAAALPRFLRFAGGVLARHTLAFYVLHLFVLLTLYSFLCRCPSGCPKGYPCLPFGIDPALFLH